MNCQACDHLNTDGARYCAKCGSLMPLNNAPDDDPLINQVVGGRYRVTGLLGEGGMGRVYTAEQQMGTAVRKVAVKTLLSEFSKDPQVVARFMRECGTVVELEHPNTIKFYDFGQTDSGDLYIAMEFVSGKPLADVIEADGAMTFSRVGDIMKQICGSLHEAHEKGVVHRDLKPENVILTTRAGQEDFVKVLDFGIAKRQGASDSAKEAKLTQAGMVLGTPPYMSPEQFTGKELDRRSDIYSLGVMAYEMLTGQLPFRANTAWEWATQHMPQQPFPFEQTGPMAAQIPPHMKQAIMRSLSKDPTQRQDTAKQFYSELNDASAAGPAARAHSGGTGTQMQEAFIPPPGAMGGPHMGGPMAAGPTMPGGAPQMTGPMAAAPQLGGGYPPAQHYNTGGAHAVPAAPYANQRSGGGGKGGLIVAAVLVAAGLGVGGFLFFGNKTNTVEDEEPIAFPTTTKTDDGDDDSGKPANSGDGDSSGGDAAGGSGAVALQPDPTPNGPNPQPPSPQPPQPPQPPVPPPPPPPPLPLPPPPPPNPSAKCEAAIAAASSRNCGAARAALSQCSGARRVPAVRVVRRYCPAR